LPDAEINSGGLKVAPLTNDVPEAAEELMRQAYARLPHLKITELLIEVDHWTGFTRHFTHLKNGEPAKDKMLLLTAILADAINLGLTKMAEACAGATVARLSWLAAWHIRDETYSRALTDIVNYQYRLPFASHWGAGITSWDQLRKRKFTYAKGRCLLVKESAKSCPEERWTSSTKQRVPNTSFPAKRAVIEFWSVLF